MVRLLYLAGLVVIFALGWRWGYEEVEFFNFGNYLVVASYAAMLLVFMNLYGAHGETGAFHGLQ